MHIPTKTYATAFAISVALFGGGCSATGSGAVADDGQEVFLQPIADAGPDPFTPSTATSTRTPPPVTQTPQTVPSGTPSASQGPISVSGGTPGLYAGTKGVNSCDVEKQISLLQADRPKARAFADTSGISQADIPTFLRGLTPVVLRVDTNVTNHGFKNGRTTSFQSVLQAGTGVLVDNRGVPRVRCACGNPLKPPSGTGFKENAPRHGSAWPGFQPTKIIVVIPAPQIIINITIINIVNNTWIERPIGGDPKKDKQVPPPSPSPSLSPSPGTTSPSPTSPSPSSPSPSVSPSSPSPSSPSPSQSPSSPSPPTTPTSASPPESPGASPPGAAPPEPSPSESQGSTLAARDDSRNSLDEQASRSDGQAS